MGIKLGRYHVYLPRMLKPKAVTLRVNLWRLFYDVESKTEIPQFGLNFLINQNFLKLFFKPINFVINNINKIEIIKI